MVEEILDYEALYGDLINKIEDMCHTNWYKKVDISENKEINDSECILNFLDCFIHALKSETFKIDFDKKYSYEDYKILKNNLDELLKKYRQEPQKYFDLIKIVFNLLAEYANAAYTNEGIQYKKGRDERFNIRAMRIFEFIKLFDEHCKSVHL